MDEASVVSAAAARKIDKECLNKVLDSAWQLFTPLSTPAYETLRNSSSLSFGRQLKWAVKVCFLTPIAQPTWSVHRSSCQPSLTPGGRHVGCNGGGSMESVFIKKTARPCAPRPPGTCGLKVLWFHFELLYAWSTLCSCGGSLGFLCTGWHCRLWYSCVCHLHVCLCPCNMHMQPFFKGHFCENTKVKQCPIYWQGWFSSASRTSPCSQQKDFEHWPHWHMALLNIHPAFILLLFSEPLHLPSLEPFQDRSATISLKPKSYFFGFSQSCLAF